MSTVIKAENIFSKVDKLEKRINNLEGLLRSAYSTHKIGALILTPQAASFFTDAANQVEGNMAYKDSSNNIYVYDGNTWDANLKQVLRYPTVADFSTTTHMADWTDWDISSIVPANCYAIRVTLVIVDDTATSYIGIRPNGGDDANFVAAKVPSGGSSTWRTSVTLPVSADLSAGQTVEIRVHDNAGSPTAVTYVRIFINGYYIK